MGRAEVVFIELLLIERVGVVLLLLLLMIEKVITVLWRDPSRRPLGIGGMDLTRGESGVEEKGGNGR